MLTDEPQALLVWAHQGELTLLPVERSTRSKQRPLCALFALRSYNRASKLRRDTCKPTGPHTRCGRPALDTLLPIVTARPGTVTRILLAVAHRCGAQRQVMPLPSAVARARRQLLVRAPRMGGQ